MTNEFAKLGLNDEILRALNDEKFEKPTEIQEKSIPLVLQGKDVIAKASTGSGKTLAFGSGLLQNIKKDFGIQGLVLAPTRELAEQIAKALKKFSKYSKLNIIPIYGGVSFNPQAEDLEYAEIVVGTPGRILDHLSRDTINLKHLKILVLDEADRMLDMGFIDDVEKIIGECPKDRQTLLFSATISPDINRLSNKYMRDQKEVEAEEYVDPDLLTQIYYDIEDNLKFSLLKHMLENEEAKLVMVFCNTRKNVDFVANNLNALGIESLPIHGGFSQEKRNKIMEKFHSQKVHVLVCTDVAARGLDIKGVTHVYNYNIPNDPKEYIHRIGRTARAGKEGKVINLISSRDHEGFRNILKEDSIKINQAEVPYINKVQLKFMPNRKSGRGFNSREGNRYNSNNNRNSYERENYSNQRRDRGIGRTSSFGNNNEERSYRSRSHDNRERENRGEFQRPNRRRSDSRDNRSRSNNRDNRSRSRHNSSRRRF